MPQYSILLTNDDGIHAEGLKSLAEALKDEAEIIVVAPDRERSACSHSMTLGIPLRVKEIKPGWWATSGTPADCVNLTVNRLLKKRPDLVISGINYGANLGCDINYSGTVSAAREAAMLGLRSMAVSLDCLNSHADFGPAAAIAKRLARTLAENQLPVQTYLNINVPALPEDKIKSIRITKQGKRRYSNNILEQNDQYGNSCYWLGGEPNGGEPIEDSDIVAVSEGYVSVTPLGLDFTQYQAIPILEALEFQV